VRFGFSLPSALEGLHYPTDFVDPAALLRLATRADELGYDSLSVADILLATDYVREHHPAPPSYYEALTTLGALAITTRRIQLATGVMAVPLRAPLPLARQAASVDAFSGGRLILGLGLGTSRAALQAADARARYRNRGAQLEEMIAALRALWQRPPASFSGDYYAFDGVSGHPAAARPYLPIYLGGNASAVARRVGRIADGWIPFGLTEDELEHSIPLVHTAATDVGRDPSTLDIAAQYDLAIAPTRERALELFEASTFHHRYLVGGFGDWMDNEHPVHERALVGTPADLIRRIRGLQSLGVTHLFGLIPVAQTLQQLEGQMELFAQEVMPAFSGSA
jgi:probable F420-dependent oxidoreductase